MSARLFRLERGLLETSGKDRQTHLQGIFSQDVKKDFPPGKATYGVFTSVKGRVIADAYVAHLDGNRFMLDVEAYAADSLYKHLDQYLILMDARLANLSPEYEMVSLIGDSAMSIVSQAFGVSLPPNGAVSVDDGFVFYSARPRLEEIRCWLKRGSAESWVSKLVSAGAVEADPSAYNAVEVEAGIPKLGKEMDESTFPQEVGLDESLNFSKGCFVGAEVLQRIFYQGHVNRALALVSAGSPAALAEGAGVFCEGEEAGRITRAALSPLLGKPIALAIVKIAALDSGKPLEARAAAGPVPLTVLKTFRAAVRA